MPGDNPDQTFSLEVEHVLIGNNLDICVEIVNFTFNKTKCLIFVKLFSDRLVWCVYLSPSASCSHLVYYKLKSKRNMGMRAALLGPYVRRRSN